MSRFNTGNPIGSTDVKDLSDNAKNLDLAVNDITNQTWEDRFGVERKTLYGIESSADSLFESIENRADTVIGSLGFLPPVPYAPGLNVDSSNFTVEHEGILYFARPGYTPFVTAEWDSEKWSPLQNTFDQNYLLIFGSEAAAENAAIKLPDGQNIEVFTSAGIISRFKVQNGVLSPAPIADVLREDLADSNSEYSGSSLIGHNGTTVHEFLDYSVAKQTSAVGALIVPSGDSSQRPEYSGKPFLRHDTESNSFEINRGAGWSSLDDPIPSVLNIESDSFINGAPLVKFGNMTKGQGLAGLFDVKIYESAYAEETVGYAGVTFSSPTIVDFIEIVSGLTGFDSSADTGNATLSLYGKNGSAPTSSTDGTKLSEIVVTDNNTQKTVTMFSNSKTPFLHIWCRITTSVWCAATEMRIFKYREFPQSTGKGMAVLMGACNHNVALTSGGLELPQFRVPIKTDSARVALIDFHSDVIHTGEGGTSAIAVGYSFSICYRSGATEEAMLAASFVPIRNAIGGGNVSERSPQHYGSCELATAVNLSSGFHQISVIGSGHTDGTNVPGILQVLSEGGQGLNCMRVTLLP